MISAEDFWIWFTDNRKRFYSVGDFYDKPLYNEFQKQLKKFHPELTFQIGGTKGESTRMLTISACGKVVNFGKVEELVSVAPIFEHWKIRAFKPADGFEVKVKVDGIEFDPSKLKFIPIELVEYPDISAIRVYMEGYNEAQNDLFVIGISALLEACIGEKAAAKEINYIDVKSQPTTTTEIQMAEDFCQLQYYLDYRKNQIKYN